MKKRVTVKVKNKKKEKSDETKIQMKDKVKRVCIFGESMLSNIN